MNFIKKAEPFAIFYSKHTKLKWRGVRFLCYHSVVDEDTIPYDYPTLAVTKKTFQRHMDIISYSTLEVISMKKALNILKNGNAKEGQYICITFDDGYLDNFTVAWPILKSFKYTAHIFLITDRIGKKCEYQSNGQNKIAEFVDKSTIIKFIGDGGSIGSHSVSHIDMTTIDSKKNEIEMKNSKSVLEEILSKPIQTFAYPYAFYNKSMFTQLSKLGYDYAFMLETGSVKVLTNRNRYQIRRTPITENEEENLFIHKITGGYDWSRYYSFIKRTLRNTIQKKRRSLHG